MSKLNEKIEVVVVSSARTPFSRFGGPLKDFSSIDMLVALLEELLRRCSLECRAIDEIIVGTCTPSETGVVAPVVARQALLKAGFPVTTLSMTIDRACCSSSTAIQLAMNDIQSGRSSIAIAAGVENMSRTPMMIPKLRWGARLGNVLIKDPLFELGYDGFNPVAVDAGNVALENGIDRQMQDAWAVQSQQRYQEALIAGKISDEIVPLNIPQDRGDPVQIVCDDFPRADTSLEKLSRLKTVYGSPTVTPGNAPGLDAGAAGVVLMSHHKAASLRIPILAKLVDVVSVADDPRQIASIPALAINTALKRVGWKLPQLSLIEINEAFAAMPLVSMRILAQDDSTIFEHLQKITNVNGGAIAVGHPVGASGARIFLTMINELKRRGGGKGIAAICGGLAQGDAMIVEVATV